ncbi:MAG: DUF4097 family beta strand repeat-containing protein [Planctomycetota bacterium]|jgi:DUF4097 and DUF4098 domain-containing protein YvlB
MKKDYFVKPSLSCLLCLLILLPGCYINIGGLCSAKFERTDKLSAPLSAGSTLAAETSFGSITVTGADVVDCHVIAEICVQAPTEEEAARIAEKVKIKLVPAGATLTVKVEKPKLKNNRSVGVSFNITVPKQTNIDCNTSFGSIEVGNINGSIKAETSFAAINCDNIKGPVHLKTSYGGITCRNITSADITATSSFGGIDIDCSPSSPPEINADIVTSYGGIDFTTPPAFAGKTDLQTSFGSIETDLPITVKGDLNEQRIKGTIGDGNGNLRLKTSFGSIKIR